MNKGMLRGVLVSNVEPEFDIERFRARQESVDLCRDADLRLGIIERFKWLCCNMRPALEQKLAAMPYRAFLETDYWQYLRDYVVMARGCRCELCGISWGSHGPGIAELRYEKLELHHLTYDHRGSEWRHWKDLQVLCRKCHEAAG